MKIEEMIEKLRYKAENIKAHIEPEFFNEVADELEKKTDVIYSLKKLQEVHKKLYIRNSEDYDMGFVEGLECALRKIRGKADENKEDH